MDKKYSGTFIKVTVIAIVAFALNFGLYYIVPDMKAQYTTFEYPIYVVYGFFYVFSILILGALLKISENNAGQVGYTFLFATSLKMAASYLLARPILAKTIEAPAEKINFFAVFVLFLAIEAYFTVRLLNKNQ
jgi:hypothetical protein